MLFTFCYNIFYAQVLFHQNLRLTDEERKTLQYIGDTLGVTRERVRQLERRALRRLKHLVRANKLLQHVLLLSHETK